MNNKLKIIYDPNSTRFTFEKYKKIKNLIRG